MMSLTLQLEPGDSVLFYTDGLTDAPNAHEQDFGVDGIQDVYGRQAGESPLHLGHLFLPFEEFTTDSKQSDDMTAAHIHFAR